MIDLAPDHLATVERILAEIVPDCEVRAYGSRVTWTAQDYSDLDLAVVGDGPLDWRTGARLTEAFEESSLPIRVEVLDWHSVPDRFRDEIERDYVVVQKPPGKHAWPTVSIGELCAIRGGSVFKREFQGRTSGDYPFIKVSDMNLPMNATSIRGANNWIEDEVAKDIGARPLPPGTVVFAKIGEALKHNRIRVTTRPTIIDNNMMGVIPKPQTVNFIFLFYAMQLFDFGTIASGTALPYLTQSSVADLLLSLPTPIEQRHIGRILRTLDDKIELNRRMCETLEEMARALFKSWFVDFDPVRAKIEGRWQPGESLPGLPAHLYDLFPDRLSPSQLGPIPRGWRVGSLGDMVELAYGKGLRAQTRRPGNVPVYGSNGRVGWHDEKLVDGPGIVVGRKGNPGLVRWSATDFYPIDTTFYVVPRGSNTSLYFLLHVLEEQDLPSIAADSAVPGLNRNLAYMSSQVIPPPQVVEQFDGCVGPLFSAHHRLEEESRTVAAIRDVLLPKLVSGDLRVAG